MSSPALYKLTAVAHTDHPGTPGEGRRTRNSKTILLRCVPSPRVSWYPANLAWKRKRKQGNKLLRKTRGLSRRKGKKNLRTRGWREPEQKLSSLCGRASWLRHSQLLRQTAHQPDNGSVNSRTRGISPCEIQAWGMQKLFPEGFREADKKAVTREGTLRAWGRGWESVGLFIVYPRILWFCLYSVLRRQATI